jgi:hypothetical protein
MLDSTVKSKDTIVIHRNMNQLNESIAQLDPSGIGREVNMIVGHILVTKNRSNLTSATHWRGDVGYWLYYQLRTSGVI